MYADRQTKDNLCQIVAIATRSPAGCGMLHYHPRSPPRPPAAAETVRRTSDDRRAPAPAPHVGLGPRRARQRSGPRHRQLGHTDAAFTLRVYSHMMRRDAGDRDRLRALVEGRVWALLGAGAPKACLRRPREMPEKRKTPALADSASSGRPDSNRGPHRSEERPAMRRMPRKRQELPAYGHNPGRRDVPLDPRHGAAARPRLPRADAMAGVCPRATPSHAKQATAAWFASAPPAILCNVQWSHPRRTESRNMRGRR